MVTHGYLNNIGFAIGYQTKMPKTLVCIMRDKVVSMFKSSQIIFNSTYISALLTYRRIGCKTTSLLINIPTSSNICTSYLIFVFNL